MLIDVRAVEWDEPERRWRAMRKRLHEVATPDTLNGLIRARIDRLEDDAREALRVACR